MLDLLYLVYSATLRRGTLRTDWHTFSILFKMDDRNNGNGRPACRKIFVGGIPKDVTLG